MTPAEQSPRQRTFADYVAIIRRRKWIALIPLILIPIAAYLYSAQQTKLYGASAEVLLSRQDLGSALTGIDNPTFFSDEDRFAETQAVLARVPEVASRALAAANVESLTPGGLLARSSVTVRGNADLMVFDVTHEDPDVAVTLATAYARAFSRYRLELDTANLANARADLNRNLQQLRRQGAAGTALYRDLATNAQQLKLIELLQTEQRVVKEPESANQVAPTPRRNAMLGVAFGLLIGLGAALLWETLDKRIRDEEELHRALGIPLLARLRAPRHENGRDRLAMLDRPGDDEAETIRRFRSNIEFANLDYDDRVLMVTSSVAGEGKSVTVSNLSIALARSGKRVALVDLDLRKPTVGTLFGLGYRSGVTDVAIQRVGLEQALVPVSLAAPEPLPLTSRTSRRGGQDDGTRRPTADTPGQLWVLPVGFLPANPGELVGTQAVANILSALRERFDYVLVDAPPLLVVSDAATLSRRVDAMVIVLRRGVVDRPMLRELSRQLAAIPARKLGFVLAGTDGDDQYGAGVYAYAKRDAVHGRREPAFVEAGDELPARRASVDRT